MKKNKCKRCKGSGQDCEPMFFPECRMCLGSGLAKDERCVRCGKLGPQCKPKETIIDGREVWAYCGID
jgi:hypothetical protein